MRSKTERQPRAIWIAIMFLFALVILVATPETGLAQWNPSPSPSPNNNIYFNAGNVGIGTTAPTSRLTVSGNSATLPAPTTTGAVAQFANADGTGARVLIDGFAGAPAVDFRRAGTTAVSPSALLSNEIMGAVAWSGYGSTGYNTAARAFIRGNAAENWSDTAQGAYLTFGTAAKTTTTTIERMRIDDAGNVGIGTSPSYPLDVAGVIHSTGGFRFPDNTVQTSAATMTGVTAGAGLTGGGTSGSATLDIGAGTGVSVAADSISVNYGSTSGTAVQGNTSITVSAGDGMSGGGPLTLGAGGTLTLTNTDKDRLRVSSRM